MSTRIGNKIVSGNNAVHKANVSLDNITSAGKEQIIVHVNENSTELTLPLATESTVGGVKVDGATISITEDGTISANVPEIDTSELALKSELDAKQDTGDYALRSELPDVSNLATKDELPTVITSYNDLTDKPTLHTVATSGSYNDLTNKPTIPSAYTLPTASTSTLGGVKVDGETIKITNGVISAESSGGGAGVASIVEVSGNSTKGYRLWSDGWCEQWGSFTCTASAVGTATLAKPYKDTRYMLVFQTTGLAALNTSGGMAMYSASGGGATYVTKKTTTQVGGGAHSGGSYDVPCANTIIYYASGYVS